MRNLLLHESYTRFQIEGGLLLIYQNELTLYIIQYQIAPSEFSQSNPFLLHGRVLMFSSLSKTNIVCYEEDHNTIVLYIYCELFLITLVHLTQSWPFFGEKYFHWNLFLVGHKLLTQFGVVLVILENRGGGTLSMLDSIIPDWPWFQTKK